MIRKMWRGDVRLVITFWVFFVLIPLPIRFFLNVMGWHLQRFGYFDGTSGDPDADTALAVYFSFTILMLIYVIFASVAVWRSAKKYKGKRIYADLAKTAMVLSWLLTIAGSL